MSKRTKEVFWVTEAVGPSAFAAPGVYVGASDTPGFGAVKAAIAAGLGEDLGLREVPSVVAYRAEVLEMDAHFQPFYQRGEPLWSGPLDAVIAELKDNGYEIELDDVRQSLERGPGHVHDDGATALIIEGAGLVELQALRVEGERKGNPEGGAAVRKVKFEFGREFFVNKRRQYGDWRMGWWREAIQNAVDAGASEVRCSVVRRPDGNFDVSVEDDGKGMSEDVLVNKFLRGGGTTKVGQAGATGGFGSAKELLLLPWLGYTIETRDLVARGVMDDITIERAATPRQAGVKLTVVMPADDYTPVYHAAGFIEKCQLPRVKFWVYDDDSGAREVKAGLRKGRVVDQIDDAAELYAPKVNYDASQVYVRVKGLFMFSRWISGGSHLRRQPIIEVTAPSVDVLTDNRDGFRNDTDLQRKVDDLVSTIAVEAERAFKKKSGLLREIYKGTGKYRVDIERREAAVLQNMGTVVNLKPQPDGSGPKVALREENVERIAIELDVEFREFGNDAIPNGALAKRLLGGVSFQGATHVSRAMKQLVWEPDFFLLNEVEGYRVPKKFRPETMQPRVYKLVKLWGELCRFVLMQLDSSEEYGIGFIFSTDTGAAHVRENGQNWLLLNPFKSMKKDFYTDKVTPGPQWRPSRFDDLKWLYALAVHEATHMSDGVHDHNVEFAYALTKNIALTADGFRRVRGIAKAIKMKDKPSLYRSEVL